MPGADEWLFAAKIFAAAMLAVCNAASIGLDRDYWVMTTVCIVAHPLSGALRPKALYRLLGTLIGTAATVAPVPNSVSAPDLYQPA